jgi:branched-chain amino acid transport system substrate-binding protein
MPSLSIKVAGVVVLALTAAACGSSSKPTASGTSPTAPSASASTQATGEPILVGAEAPITGPILVQPELKAALEASISAINAAGGIHGRPLKLQFCDTQYNANKELSCMRELIAAKVSAVISPEIINDQSGRPYQLASTAGVPVLGGLGLTPAEFSIKGVYALSSGIPGWVYGAVEHLLATGSKKIGLLGTNEAGSSFFIGLSAAALKSAGVTPAVTATVDPEADPTFSSGAAKASGNGVDGIILATNPKYVPKAVLALKQAGYKGKISSITAIFGPAIVKALGSAADGVLLTSQVAFPADSTNPGVKSFNADMDAYQPSAERTEQALNGWAGVQLFAKVMGSASSFNASDVLAAFSGLSTPVDLGLAGPFRVVGKATYLKMFPNIYNPTVQNGTVTGGKVLADGKGFINPFTALMARAH